MDEIISGFGIIKEGVYENIAVNGSCNVSGDIKCSKFSLSGSCKFRGRTECDNELQISGAAEFDKDVIAGAVLCSGAVSFHGDIKSKDVSLAGTTKIGGKVDCKNFSCSGIIESSAPVNAENVNIIFGEKSKVRYIGGTTVMLGSSEDKKSGILKKIFASKGRLTVTESINGDTVNITDVNSPLVSGKDIVIGDGCVIDRVIFSGTLDASPKAKIKEKVYTE